MAENSENFSENHRNRSKCVLHGHINVHDLQRVFERAEREAKVLLYSVSQTKIIE